MTPVSNHWRDFLSSDNARDDSWGGLFFSGNYFFLLNNFSAFVTRHIQLTFLATHAETKSSFIQHFPPSSFHLGAFKWATRRLIGGCHTWFVCAMFPYVNETDHARPYWTLVAHRRWQRAAVKSRRVINLLGRGGTFLRTCLAPCSTRSYRNETWMRSFFFPSLPWWVLTISIRNGFIYKLLLSWSDRTHYFKPGVILHAKCHYRFCGLGVLFHAVQSQQRTLLV